MGDTKKYVMPSGTEVTLVAAARIKDSQMYLHVFLELVMKEWERGYGSGVVEAVEAHPIYRTLMSLTHEETGILTAEDSDSLTSEGQVFRTHNLKVRDFETEIIEGQTLADQLLGKQALIIQAAAAQLTEGQTLEGHLFEGQSFVEKTYQDHDPNGHTSKN